MYSVLDNTSSDQVVELWLQGTKTSQKHQTKEYGTHHFSQVLSFFFLPSFDSIILTTCMAEEKDQINKM